MDDEHESLSMEEAVCMSGHGAERAFSVFSVLLPDCGTGRLSYRFPCQGLRDSSRKLSQPPAMAGRVGCGESGLFKLLSSPQQRPETRVSQTLVAPSLTGRGPSVDRRRFGWLSSLGMRRASNCAANQRLWSGAFRRPGHKS